MGGLPGLPTIVKNLIIINVLMWIAQLTFKGAFTNALALHYYQSPDFGIWQIVTYMFLHAPDYFFHLLFNMFGLWPQAFSDFLSYLRYRRRPYTNAGQCCGTQYLDQQAERW